MIPKPSNIFVKLTEEERAKIFERPITTSDGRHFQLMTQVPAEEGIDESFTQTVSVGVVVAVGSQVKGFKEGDVVIVDYTVDISHEFLVEVGDDYKIMSLNAITTYEEEDKIVDPNQRVKHSTVIHRAGDLKDPSMIIAYVRDGVIHPNFPYVFVEYIHVNEEEQSEESGLWIEGEESKIADRKVLFSYKGSELLPDDIIIAESDAIFNRELNGQKFGVIYEHDIIGILEQQHS